MNKSIIALLLSVISISTYTPCHAAKGEKSVGLRAGFTTTNNAPVAGLYFKYGFTDYFRLAPDLDYYFRHDNTDAFALNINAEFPFALGKGSNFNIYPLAGFNFTSWNTHNTISIDMKSDSDDSSTRSSRMGFNVGAGVEYYATPTLKFSVEGKYGCIKHFDGGIITASIGYVF